MAEVVTRYLGDMLFETQLGNHAIRIDVPDSMGGSDRGPTPPELFVASLGSCVGAFVASYCDKAEIDMDGMNVVVSFDKASNPTRLTNLQVKVNMPNDGCKNREKAIKMAASHCPVHETIKTFEGLQLDLQAGKIK